MQDRDKKVDQNHGRFVRQPTIVDPGQRDRDQHGSFERSGRPKRQQGELESHIALVTISM